MSNTFSTLTDLAKINDRSIADLEISDLLDDAPFFKHLAAEPSSNGTEHKYTKETGAPVVGFRAPNVGRDLSKSTDTLVTLQLKILDAGFAVDKAVADAYRGGPEAWIAREGRRHIKAAFAKGEGSILNGDSGASFDGLRQAMPYLDTPGVVNAAGNTANQQSSIYLVRTNGDGNDVTLIGANQGGDGIDIAMGETVVQVMPDGSGKPLPMYYTPVSTWLGLQVGGKYSIVRIANIGAATAVDDDMIYAALAEFPTGRQPNLILMNRQHLKKLRQSRTATNATGAPAPRPADVDGIPIIVTDFLTQTEPVVGASP
ncbi:MAG: hypothetical protein KF774_17800 [Planctomyces sp.]|nr:hypothetical protein [Planctomyces sp.]